MRVPRASTDTQTTRIACKIRHSSPLHKISGDQSAESRPRYFAGSRARARLEKKLVCSAIRYVPERRQPGHAMGANLRVAQPIALLVRSASAPRLKPVKKIPMKTKFSFVRTAVLMLSIFDISISGSRADHAPRAVRPDAVVDLRTL